ncbi:hypothetical protein [Sorangium sp. So ce542]|uniref:hypothetical protein n=1 Tax=Sorangium sp. So ce542 TaxID=3133316 RepID=UPI003F5F9989
MIHQELSLSKAVGVSRIAIGVLLALIAAGVVAEARLRVMVALLSAMSLAGGYRALKPGSPASRGMLLAELAAAVSLVILGIAHAVLSLR